MKKILLFVFTICSLASVSIAQDTLPRDNGIRGYHEAPDYRESESSPFRMVAYVLHPIGWFIREGVVRPIDYVISSNFVTKSIFGYRDPYDYKEVGCFNSRAEFSDCKKYPPYNYDSSSNLASAKNGLSDVSTDCPYKKSCAGNNVSTNERQVYLPDVNFDFDKRELNTLGKGKARVIAKLLKEKPRVNIVLNGHADYIGSDSYNKKLSMDRAEALKKELVYLGVPSDRISTLSFGKSQPNLKEKDAPARAINRRVEIVSGAFGDN